MTRLIAISDLHGTLPEIPKCDILVIAGDVCPLDNHQLQFQKIWLKRRFNEWLNDVPAKSILGIGGNHDFALEDDYDLALNLDWLYMLDTDEEIEGLKFYGYPWVPNLPSWAFHASDDKLLYHASNIPDDVEVLVTHGPPAGVGDKVSHTHVGDRALANQLSYVLRPRLHVFGHIHEGRGRHIENGITLANVSIVDRNYRHIHSPMEFDL